jgi:hypothetical protein
MMQIHKRVLDIMQREREHYWQLVGGKFSHELPTFLIRKQYNAENDIHLTADEMRFVMNELAASGHVKKHSRSRIGQAHWQLTDKEAS